MSFHETGIGQRGAKECVGTDHQWDSAWQSGDTCACGMFYLFTDGAKCWLAGSGDTDVVRAAFVAGMYAASADASDCESMEEFIKKQYAVYCSQVGNETQPVSEAGRSVPSASAEEENTKFASLVNERRESGTDHGAADECLAVYLIRDGKLVVEPPRRNEEGTEPLHPSSSSLIPSVEILKAEIMEEVEKFAIVAAPDDHELTTPHETWMREKIDALILAVQQQSAQEIEKLDLKWAAASEFIRDVIEAVGRSQPTNDAFVVNLPELALQVVGQIEEWKVRAEQAEAALEQSAQEITRHRSDCKSLECCQAMKHGDPCGWHQRHSIHDDPEGKGHQFLAGPCDCQPKALSPPPPSPPQESR